MVTKQQMESTNKYKKKTYKRVPLELRFEEYDELKKYCDSNGLSVNGFIKEAIKKALPN